MQLHFVIFRMSTLRHDFMRRDLAQYEVIDFADPHPVCPCAVPGPNVACLPVILRETGLVSKGQPGKRPSILEWDF